MSREEAAAAYLDNLLGFRGKYIEYQSAINVLSDNDKKLLDGAAAAWLKDDVSKDDKE